MAGPDQTYVMHVSGDGDDDPVQVPDMNHSDNDDAPEAVSTVVSSEAAKARSQREKSAAKGLRDVETARRRARDSYRDAERAAKRARQADQPTQPTQKKDVTIQGVPLLPKELLAAAVAETEARPSKKRRETTMNSRVLRFDDDDHVEPRIGNSQISRKRVETLAPLDRTLSPRSDGPATGEREGWLQGRAIMRPGQVVSKAVAAAAAPKKGRGQRSFAGVERRVARPGSRAPVNGLGPC